MTRLLHTDSSMFQPNIKWMFRENYSKWEIAQAKHNEKKLYNMFGVENFGDFRKKFEELFSNNENDRMAFLQMANAQIADTVERHFGLGGGIYETRGLVVNIKQTAAWKKFNEDFDKTVDYLQQVLENIQAKGAKDFLGVKIEADKKNRTGTIIFGDNTYWGRTNEYYTYRLIFQKNVTIKGDTNTYVADPNSVTEKLTRAITNNNYNTYGNEELREIFENYVENHNKDAVGEKDPHSGMRSSKAQLLALYKNQRQQYIWLMSGIRRTVKDWIGYNSTSREFQEAFNQIWDDNFSDFTNFWSKHDNVKDGIIGAMGELQAAMIPKYMQLRLKSNSGIPKAITAILTDNLEQSVLGKSDVDLEYLNFENVLKRIGIQSKNVADISGIDVSAHPSEIDRDGFADHIINSYFNSDVKPQPTEKEIINYVLTEIPRTFHTDLTDAIEARNTVSFYMVQGLYLVPVSAILESVIRKGKNQNVKISFPKKIASWNDKEFLKDNSETDMPLLLDYWWPVKPTFEKGKHGCWYYMTEAEKTWTNIDSHTSFTLTSTINKTTIGKYRLFT